MAFSLFQLLADWENLGFFHIALPFLLVFTLVFAILQKTRILGPESKQFNAIVAIIIGALTVRNQFIVELIQRFLPNISMFVIIALMFLLLVGIFGGKEFSGFTGGWMLAVAIISFLLVGWALTADFLFAPPWLFDLFLLQDVSALALIGAFAFGLWFVLHEETGRAPLKDVMDWFTGRK